MSDPLQPELPPVDLALLSEVFENDADQIREVLVLYMEQTDEQVKGLAQAIAAGNPEAIRQLAHKAAGASASCGMTQIVPLLRELERMGKEQKLAGAEEAYVLVQNEFNSIGSFIKKHLNS